MEKKSRMITHAKKIEKQAESGIDYNMQMELELFSIEKEDYSNKIDIWDALPKYHADKTSLVQKEKIKFIKKECSIAKQKFYLEISPALVETKDKEIHGVFPSLRESYVEEAVRMLATRTDRIKQRKTATGVVFSLYELLKELKAQGHTMSLVQLKTALTVCRKATYTITSTDQADSLVTSIFTDLRFSKRTGPDGEKHLCYVEFSPLVTAGILAGEYRLYDYKKSMELKTVLSRHLHTRMSLYWKQASNEHPYAFSLVSTLRQVGREDGTQEGTTQKDRRAMETALDELVAKDILLSYEKELIKEGKRIIDIKYIALPHPEFIRDIKYANHLQIKNKTLLELNSQKKGIRSTQIG